uniref:DUF5523 domain-containing protein n=1 Tax=Spermophilus dauricus TaxID=99837 RepID=A0A8C9USF2_SPEDA
ISEETVTSSVEEIEDTHLSKELDTEENQNIIETLRGKVREKLKNAKVRFFKFSCFFFFKCTTEVLLDDGLSFFILSGEEGSALDQSSEQKSVNDSYFKHFSLGDNSQNVAESQDEDFMEEILFADLIEIKAAEYEDDQEQIKKQQANIFVPSSSPVANQCKLPKGMIPRILEDEGFYVQRKPKIYKKTCNKMENRLLKLEKGKCWFEESGEIMSLPSPIKQSWNFRLNISKESLNPALKTIYRKVIRNSLFVIMIEILIISIISCGFIFPSKDIKSG